jgi:hypothetical protein
LPKTTAFFESEFLVHQGGKVYFPDELIRDFRVKTKLSIRKIAEITGLNKDRVNKILKS